MIAVRQVDADAPDQLLLSQAVLALHRGLLLIYPTETLYALGGLATAEAAARIRAAKGRDDRKPLPLIAGDPEQARGLCAIWTGAAERLATRFWPGPLTLVLRADPALPSEVTAGGGAVAVRVPGLALARELCLRAGPLVSTSANRSGEPPHAACAPAVEAVGAYAELALDAGALAGVPSTVVDVSGQPRLLRAGAVPLEEVAGALRATGATLQTGG